MKLQEVNVEIQVINEEISNQGSFALSVRERDGFEGNSVR
jgi:hypothetical protein